MVASPRTIVIGGGIAGASVVFELAKRGIASLLLEAHTLTSGTTWHSAGNVGRMGSDIIATELRKYSSQVYSDLQASGLPLGYKLQGGLSIAYNKARWQRLRKTAEEARVLGVPSELLAADEVALKYPDLELAEVVGGLWSPLDGQINSSDATFGLVKVAKTMADVEVQELTRVTGLSFDDSGISAVETSQGTVECSSVVLCAGMWTRDAVNSLLPYGSVNIPLWPCEHHYIITTPLSDDHRRALPVLRLYDEQTYLKEDAGRLLIGFFESHARAAFEDSTQVPLDFAHGSFPTTEEHYLDLMTKVCTRIPWIAELGWQTMFSGPEAFTFDGHPFVGRPTTEISNFYVCAGFNSHGITYAPGCARWIAAAIADGEVCVPTSFQASRFSDVAEYNHKELKLRARNVLAAQYSGRCSVDN